MSPIRLESSSPRGASSEVGVRDAVRSRVTSGCSSGIDAIELSGGLLTGGKLSPIRPGIDSFEKEAYFKEELRAFKKAINIPLILVGGIRSFEVAEQLVTEGTADYISMSRPFIREPDLINRWQAGDRRPCRETGNGEDQQAQHSRTEHATSGRAVVVSVIDNLVKGAAGQAVQNMNIMFGLDETRGKLIENLSHGTRQRVVIASALLHDPKVLIIDEPMVGLDPRSVRIAKDLLRSQASAGKTVFMSTHTLAIAEEISDRIGILNGGRLHFLGTVPELQRELSSPHASLEPLFLELTNGSRDGASNPGLARP